MLFFRFAQQVQTPIVVVAIIVKKIKMKIIPSISEIETISVDVSREKIAAINRSKTNSTERKPPHDSETNRIMKINLGDTHTWRGAIVPEHQDGARGEFESRNELELETF